MAYLVFTCDTPGSGTFTIHQVNKTWRVITAAGDFAGLQGEGECKFVSTGDDVGQWTFHGTIRYPP